MLGKDYRLFHINGNCKSGLISNCVPFRKLVDRVNLHAPRIAVRSFKSLEGYEESK